MLDYWRLDFLDGDFLLIFKDDIPLVRHRRVRAYHLELKKVLARREVYPDSTDLSLYPEFAHYYQKVMSAIAPDVDCNQLESRSRHEFFVCTDPVLIKNQHILGFSGIEQLMGYRFLEEDSVPTPICTTGDDILDVETDIFLIFKRNAPGLIERHSLDDLARMAKQANDRMRDASDEEKDSSEEVAPKEVEDEEFTKYKPLILERLTRMEVPVPTGF